MKEVLFAEGILGKQAELFFESDLGQAILGMAEQEVKEAFESFKAIDPRNYEQVRDIQNKILRAESFKSWLAELIIKGQQAVKQLELDKTDD